MSTDRELLRGAAKAAGELGPDWFDNDDYFESVLSRWKPLNDDGDALRLAVSLRLEISPWLDWVSISRDGLQLVSADVYQGGIDFQAVVRRAIVRAAAAIGEDMP
jgi:hypothetical protein